MVKITFAPYNEVVVHEVLELDNQTFFEDVIRQALASPAHAEPTVNWIDEVAFTVSLIPPTDDIVKENLAGRIHFANVVYTRVQFRNQVSVRIGNQEYNARLRKADSNRTLVDLVKFLKAERPG